MSELPFDASGYLGELAVVERPYEHQACVRSLGFGPLARKRREVTTVAGYENTLLGCCQLEHLRIWHALVGGVPGWREHVVLALAKPRGDATRREVRVEQQAQTAWLCSSRELDERIQLVPLLGYAAVLLDCLSHLIGVALAISQCDAHLALGQLCLCQKPLD